MKERREYLEMGGVLKLTPGTPLSPMPNQTLLLFSTGLFLLVALSLPLFTFYANYPHFNPSEANSTPPHLGNSITPSQYINIEFAETKFE